MRLQIYDKSGDVKAIAHEIEITGRWMEGSTATVKIQSPEPIYFASGDYLEYNGRRYVLDIDAPVTKNATQGTYGNAFEYSNVRFEGIENELKKVMMLDFVVDDNKVAYSWQPTFSFYCNDVRDFAQRIADNINRDSSNLKGRWEVVFVEGYVTSAINVSVDINNETIYDALKKLNTIFYTTYTFKVAKRGGDTVYQIVIGDYKQSSEKIIQALKYGKGNGLKKLGRSISQDFSDIVNKLYVYGSEKNFNPDYYHGLRTKTHGNVISTISRDEKENHVRFDGFDNGFFTIKTAVVQDCPDSVSSIKNGATAIMRYCGSEGPYLDLRVRSILYIECATSIPESGIYVGPKSDPHRLKFINANATEGFDNTLYNAINRDRYYLGSAFENTKQCDAWFVQTDGNWPWTRFEVGFWVNQFTRSKEFANKVFDNTARCIPLYEEVATIRVSFGTDNNGNWSFNETLIGTQYKEYRSDWQDFGKISRDSWGHENKIRIDVPIKSLSSSYVWSKANDWRDGYAKISTMPSKATDVRFLEAGYTGQDTKGYQIEAFKLSGGYNREYEASDTIFTDAYLSINRLMLPEFAFLGAVRMRDGETPREFDLSNPVDAEEARSRGIEYIPFSSIYVDDSEGYYVMRLDFTKYIGDIATTYAKGQRFHHVLDKEGKLHRKFETYLENMESQAKYGVREGSVNFDKEDAVNGISDVYPTLNAMRYEDVVAAGYECTQRPNDNGFLDEVFFASHNIDGSLLDDGVPVDNHPQSIPSNPNVYASTCYVFVKDLGFDIQDYSYGKDNSPKMAINTGACAGMEFDVKSIKQQTMYCKPDGTDSSTEPSAERTVSFIANVLEIARIFDSPTGLYYPNCNARLESGVLRHRPEDGKDVKEKWHGDQFVITNIYMPRVYIDSAAQKLRKYGEQYLLTKARPRYVFTPEIDNIFIQRDYDNAENKEQSIRMMLQEGVIVNIDAQELEVENYAGDVTLRVDTFTIKEGKTPIPEYTMVLKEVKEYTLMQRMQMSLGTIETTGFNILEGNASQQKQFISAIMPSFEGRYIHKDIDDTAEGKITFAGGLVSEEKATFEDDVEIEGNAIVGGTLVHGETKTADFTQGSLGHGVWQDEEGMWHIETDYVSARKRFYAKEVLIEEVKHSGGIIMLSAAQAKAEAVVEAGNSYIVFFNSSDGEGNNVAENPWVEGDLAYCENFSTPETVEATDAEGNPVFMQTQHRYWRKVVGVGSGYSYGYSEYAGMYAIELSKDDCEAGSSVPMVGDHIVQMGNANNDEDRNGVTIIAGAGQNAGKYLVYDGVHTYNLGNPKVEIGPKNVFISADRFEFRTNSGAKKNINDLEKDVSDISEDKFEIYDLDVAAPKSGEKVKAIITTQEMKNYGISWPVAEYPDHYGDFAVFSDGVTYKFEDTVPIAWRLVTDTYLIEYVQDVNANKKTLADMASDLVITIQEKPELERWWKKEDGEYNSLMAQWASVVGIPQAGDAASNFIEAHGEVHNWMDKFLFKEANIDSVLTETEKTQYDTDVTHYFTCREYVAKGITFKLKDRINEIESEGIEADIRGRLDEIQRQYEGVSDTIQTWDSTFYTVFTQGANPTMRGEVIQASGLVTETNYASLFSRAIGQDGKTIAEALAATYVGHDENGNIVSGITLSADQIDFSGKTIDISAEKDLTISAGGENPYFFLNKEKFTVNLPNFKLNEHGSIDVQNAKIRGWLIDEDKWITPDNLENFITDIRYDNGNVYITLNFQTISKSILFTGDFTAKIRQLLPEVPDTFNPNIQLPSILPYGQYTQEYLDMARTMIGNTITIMCGEFSAGGQNGLKIGNFVLLDGTGVNMACARTWESTNGDERVEWATSGVRFKARLHKATDE